MIRAIFQKGGNLFQSTYTIDKSSNTFADNLAAFGLAYVLNTVVDGRAKIRIEDYGPVFAVVCEPAMKAAWVEECRFFTGAPFLITLDNKSQTKVIKGASLKTTDVPEQGGSLVVDYQVEKQNRESYWSWYKSLPNKDEQKKAIRGELPAPVTMHPDWDIFRAVNPGALQGYNHLMAEWWRGREAFPALLKILLEMTAQNPNDIEGANAAWVKLCREKDWSVNRANASQLFNPSQGKGTNSSKAIFRAPGNLPAFWLLEWLKVVGLFYSGITRIVANPKDPRNAKDRKTYILSPCKLDWNRHQVVMKDFRKAMSKNYTAVQMDILAALLYTQAFLSHYEGAREEELAEELFGHGPANLVAGMQMAFYKNLGNSTATMNIASINLPRWVVLQGPDSLVQFQDTIQNHIQVVRGLDENHGDQYDLLSHYRDFMSANDLNPFFKFTNAFSGFIISQHERGKFVQQFTTDTLEVLFMNSDQQGKTYTTIVQNEGFRNIAYAIRHSTVIPQMHKGKGNRPVVNVRYGLGQQLARKAAYPADFLAELSEFLQLYNAENAQLNEKNRNPFRKNVTTGDIEEIIRLVDSFGSKVVCNMLVAYGYAREPRGDKETPSSETATDINDLPLDDTSETDDE
jgi:hypothetical protein